MPPELSVIIPTYGREEVLGETIKLILTIASSSVELIVVDQTPSHTETVRGLLETLDRDGQLNWIRLSRPSITQAMNQGAQAARGRFLLYVDDDIKPDPGLLDAHLRAHDDGKGELVAGRVLQPWHSDRECSAGFTESDGKMVSEFIGCNFSIRREVLFDLGGFDERFRGAAYRYEREFSDRLLAAGHRIWYEPSALIRHLHHASGGTRSNGGHLTSWNPRHPVGAYYYLLVSPRVRNRARRALQRWLRSVVTRHHLRRPWYIPVTLTSETLGLCWALWLRLQGPALPLGRADRAAVAP